MSVTIIKFVEDEILPDSITHECEQDEEGMMPIYNYIRYEFETDAHYYWARSYIGEIKEVSIYGPFEKQDRKNIDFGKPIDDRIIQYFGRRFPKLTRLTESGYVEIT